MSVSGMNEVGGDFRFGVELGTCRGGVFALMDARGML